MRRIFLGQDAAATQPVNRLDSLRLHVIKDRRSLLAAAGADGLLTEDPAAVRAKVSALEVDVSSWTDEDISTLIVVNNAPSPDEISDLSLIDSLFLVGTARMVGKNRAEEMADLLSSLACEGRGDPEKLFGDLGARRRRLPEIAWLPERGFGQRRVDPPLAANPFFCTPQGPLQPPRSFYFTARQSFADFFKIDPEETWGRTKGVVANIQTLLGVLSDYPFPSPISAMPGVWYQFAQDDLAALVKLEGVLTPRAAKTGITLAILDHYDAASERIVHLLKKKEKKRRRRQLIKNIALGVVSLVSLIALPAAISSGFEAVTGLMNTLQAREAAKDLAKAAKQFAESDAAFSEELQRISTELDYQAAQEEAATQFTEDEMEAAAEEGYETEIPPGTFEPAPEAAAGVPTELFVGGGIAAAAALAIALFA